MNDLEMKLKEASRLPFGNKHDMVGSSYINTQLVVYRKARNGLVKDLLEEWTYRFIKSYWSGNQDMIIREIQYFREWKNYNE